MALLPTSSISALTESRTALEDGSISVADGNDSNLSPPVNQAIGLSLLLALTFLWVSNVLLKVSILPSSFLANKYNLSSSPLNSPPSAILASPASTTFAYIASAFVLVLGLEANAFIPFQEVNSALGTTPSPKSCFGSIPYTVAIWDIGVLYPLAM